MWYAPRMTGQVAVRLPEELISRLDALVPATHPSRSDAVRRAIELYLYWLACEQDARQYERLPFTDVELSLTDDPDAWSGTPQW
jgi:Arc/MetJ-type ribon-helix-helix transcriptional regulator